MEIREMRDAVETAQPIAEDAPLTVGQELVIADEGHDWYGARVIVTAPTTGPQVSIVTVEADGELGDPARLERTQLRARPLLCEIYVSDRAGHCTGPAVRVAYVADEPALRILACGAHPRVMNNGLTAPQWNSLTVQEYQAAYGPLVRDAALYSGRKAPQD